MKDIVYKVMEMAISQGAQGARVTYSEGSESSFSILDNVVDKIQSASSRSLYIQLFIDQRYGGFSTNKMDEDEIRGFIAKAVENTRMIAPDEYRSLPDPSLCCSSNNTDLLQFDNSFASITPQQKRDFIFDISNEIDRSNKSILSVSNEYEDNITSIFMADSNGFKGEIKQTDYHSFTECTLKDRGNSRVQNGWHDCSIFFDTLKHGSGEKALERALRMTNPVKIKSGKYNIVLENKVSLRFVMPIISALSGGAIQQNHSFLLDSLGEKVFPEVLTLRDTPHEIGEMGSRYFDGEGLATKPMDIITDGVVSTYFLSTYFAKKLGMTPTIDSPSIQTISSVGAENQQEMLKDLGKGILITGFIGGNCNLATGDFSYGIEGFYFENSEIKHPIKEMNMTSNILSLWQDILHIGNDYRENSGGWKIPSLSFKNIDISGI